MDEILQEFLSEAFEHLERFDQDMEQLDAAPADVAALEEAHRSLHTIKGASGFLALSQLETLTAAGELLLGRAQKGQLTLTPERLRALTELGGTLRDCLEQIQASGHEGEVGSSELVDRLALLAVS